MLYKELTEDQKGRFWDKVNIHESTKECWEWEGAKKPTGYGNVSFNGKHYISHRVAFELLNEFYPKQFIVMHICDNRSCCNPHHLVLGTIKTNAIDMLIKNRGIKTANHALGENNFNAKLNPKKVRNIKKLLRETDMYQWQIADIHGVTQTAISSIKLNKTWSHINV